MTWAPGSMVACTKGTTQASELLSMRCKRMRPKPLGCSISTATATSTLLVLLLRLSGEMGASRSVMAR